MKYVIAIIMVAWFASSCNEGAKKPAAQETREPDPLEHKDSVPVVARDSVPVVKQNPETYSLVSQSRQVLGALKNHDLMKFASFIHPTLGVRFSPYGHIDTVVHRSFLPQELVNLSASREKIFWGYYDGSGDSINLNVTNYFTKFVYNADFLSKAVSVNRMVGSGNSLNNLQTVYKDAVFTESYIPGVNPKYAGMDWCSLRLVYKKAGAKFYLVAVVHDQWTI